jgi:membrane protein involved in colicin uptake
LLNIWLNPLQEVSELKKNTDRLEETVKKLKSESHSDVVRLNRQQEEIDRLRESEQKTDRDIKVG